jgi:hypothetical protein
MTPAPRPPPPSATPLPPAAEAFLRRLSAGLAPLPAGEREDVLAEVRDHLAARHAQGRLDLAGEFGEPEAYAARFLSAHALSGALAHGGALALGRALLTGAGRTLLTLLVVVPLWVLHAAGWVLVGLGALKPLLPGTIGLWVGEGVFVLGAFSGSPGAPERLGYWAVPLFLAGGVLLAWAAHRALHALARRRLQPRA